MSTLDINANTARAFFQRWAVQCSAADHAALITGPTMTTYGQCAALWDIIVFNRVLRAGIAWDKEVMS